jgi:hypothetical protein
MHASDTRTNPQVCGENTNSLNSGAESAATPTLVSVGRYPGTLGFFIQQSASGLSAMFVSPFMAQQCSSFYALELQFLPKFGTLDGSISDKSILPL